MLMAFLKVNICLTPQEVSQADNKSVREQAKAGPKAA
jgi:hypothetical protein